MIKRRISYCAVISLLYNLLPGNALCAQSAAVGVPIGGGLQGQPLGTGMIGIARPLSGGQLGSAM